MSARSLREAAGELRVDDRLRREAFSMSLYVAIVLLSALSILSGHPPGRGAVFLLILGTTVGLVLAHSFAVWVAARVVGLPADDDRAWDVLRVQLVGAGLVATPAMLAVALASTADELFAARSIVSATIAALVYGESRRHHPVGRAVAAGLLALVLALVVAGLKTALAH